MLWFCFNNTQFLFVGCMHVWFMCLHVRVCAWMCKYRGQRSVLHFLLYHCPPLLTEPGAQSVAGVTVQWAPRVLISASQCWDYRHMHLASYTGAREPIRHLPNPIHHFFNDCLHLTFLSVGRLCNLAAELCLCFIISLLCQKASSGRKRKAHWYPGGTHIASRVC